MPLKTLAAIVIIFTIANLIVLKAWKIKCMASREERLFNSAKKKLIREVKEQCKIEGELLDKRKDRLIELDQKIESRQATLETLKDLTGGARLDKSSMSPI